MGVKNELVSARKQIAGLQAALVRAQKRCEELEKDAGRLARRAYYARVFVHELIDMALFDKTREFKK